MFSYFVWLSIVGSDAWCIKVLSNEDLYNVNCFYIFLFWKEWHYDLLFMKVNIDVQSGYYLKQKS